MALADIIVERAFAQLDEAGRGIEAVAGTEVEVTPKESDRDAMQIDVELTGEALSADLVVDVEREVVVATRLEAEASVGAKGILKACEHVGRQVDCGSLFVPPDLLAPDAPRDPWERAGFRQNFILPAEPSGEAEHTHPVPQSDGFIDGGALADYHDQLQEAVGMELEWGVAHVDRPYIVSLDVASSLAAGEAADFHCFVHFHELSGACYVEKVVVPEGRRGRGIGTKVFHSIHRLARRCGSDYIYLVAKQEAERFWAKQGFRAIQRVNYRNLDRRKDALRKVPGWEVGRVGHQKLRDPVWKYRNHPQDDLDLAAGLDHLNLS